MLHGIGEHIVGKAFMNIIGDVEGRRCILFDEGELVEENTPEDFFSNPKHDRTKLFLEQIL